MPWDVFLSHASEEKALIAEPLARALEEEGISVWIDKDQITLGDGFRKAIDRGLTHARFGAVPPSRCGARRRHRRARRDRALKAKNKKQKTKTDQAEVKFELWPTST